MYMYTLTGDHEFRRWPDRSCRATIGRNSSERSGSRLDQHRLQQSETLVWRIIMIHIKIFWNHGQLIFCRKNSSCFFSHPLILSGWTYSLRIDKFRFKLFNHSVLIRFRSVSYSLCFLSSAQCLLRERTLRDVIHLSYDQLIMACPMIPRRLLKVRHPIAFPNYTSFSHYSRV